MCQVKNKEIRERAKSCKVRLWEIAEAKGISEATMVRKMRRELSPGEKDELLLIIGRLAREKAEVS